VLEQVAQVFAGQQAHPARARVADHRQLEVDQRRAAVLGHQPVGLLGQVVMGHAAPVQLLQQAPRSTEPGQVAPRRALVHRIAGHEAAVEMATIPVQQLRHVGHALDMAQRACFAAGQPPRRHAQPQRRCAQVAAYEGALRPLHEQDAAEAVGLQGMRWSVGRVRHAPILGDGAGCKRSPSRWEPVTFTPL